MVADELRRQADTFIELNDLAPQLARKSQDIPLPGSILDDHPDLLSEQAAAPKNENLRETA